MALSILTKLVQHGDDLALVIDRGLLDLLKITKYTPLEITVENNTLVITPISEQMWGHSENDE